MIHDEYGQSVDIAKLAQKLATSFISSVPPASGEEVEDKAFIRHPDAYIYLAETYLKHEIAEGNNDLEDCKKKLHNELFPGLTRYFKYADVKQNELIAASAHAARETILADTLFARLRWPNKGSNNPYYSIDSVKQMVASVIKSTLNGEAPVLEVGGELYQKLHAAAIEVRKAYNLEQNHQLQDDSGNNVLLGQYNKKDRPHVIEYYVEKKLHKAIDNLLQVIKLSPRDITAEGYVYPMKSFVAKRRDLTQIYNGYQVRLSQLAQLTEHGLTLESLPTQDSEKLQLLRHALEQRQGEVEAYRNVYLTALPEQPAILSQCEFSHNDLKKLFRREGAQSGFTRLADDIPAAERQSSGSIHPLLDEVAALQRRAHNTLTSDTTTYTYRQIPPAVDFIEFGKKSWRRAIEKLVHEKDSDWKKMNDLSRINPVFSRPESIYRFNKILRRNGVGEMHDKGMKVVPTGSPLWISVINAGEVEPGIPWGMEIKSDDAHMRQFESYHHQIYECIRLLEGKKRGEIDFMHLGDTFPKFIRETDHIMELMYQHANIIQPEAVRNVMLLPEVQERMCRIASKAQVTREFYESPNPEDQLTEEQRVMNARFLHRELEELHAVICFAAARTNPNPAMAAFYDRAMRKTFPQLENPEAQEKMPKLAKLYMQHGPYAELQNPENRKHVVYARLLDEDYQRSRARGSRIEKTIAFIKQAFANQNNEFGEPEYLRSINILKILPADVSEDVKCAALLHNVVEKADVTLEDIQAHGYSDLTCRIVKQLTKTKETDNHQLFVNRIIEDGLVHEPDLAGAVVIQYAAACHDTLPEQQKKLDAVKRKELTRKYTIPKIMLKRAVEALGYNNFDPLHAEGKSR